MKRRTKFFFICITLLFCWQIAIAQNLTVQITPQSTPIEIPPEGGSFSYQVSVTNHESTPQQVTLWCIVTTPEGDQRLALQPWTAGITAGQTVQRSFTQTAPAASLMGNYVLTANIGIYPNTVWDSDQFTFYKLKPPEWVARYTGPGTHIDQANSLAVDGSGNVYVTGGSYRSGNGYDYATIKYNSAGFQEWVARYNGPGNDDDYARSLVLDSSGNVYVTGFSYGSGLYQDYATIKYNSAGVQQWVARYNGPGNYYDSAYSLAVDGNGNVYVTGYSYGSGTNRDYTTIKYNSAGVQEWVARYNGPGNSYDYAYSLAVDGSGNVYVTGNSCGSGTYSDYATIKYNSAGVQEWVARYNGPYNSSDYARSLAVDGSGNVYVTGYSWGSGTNGDYATIKYNSAGVQEWVAHYNGPGYDDDYARSLAVDGSGNVYVTGYSYGSGTYWDYATIKYNSAGVQEWVARYNGSGNLSDRARSLAVDGNGNVYVTGYSHGSGFYDDYATIKYNSVGVQEWVARYNGPGNNLDYTISLAVDGSGNVYVTGTSYESGTNDDYATIKYSGGNLAGWEPVTVTVLGAPLPKEYRLEQNYPNPFNPTTTISYTLPTAGLVNLSIYDVAGKRVAELVNGRRDAGVQQVTFDGSALATGVYFCRLQAGDYSGVQKMALVK
ncbi:MAG: SBBP repeat-containing protein [bacterium]|nr:SBBP repeat-containing protein [bacterium]